MPASRLVRESRSEPQRGAARTRQDGHHQKEHTHLPHPAAADVEKTTLCAAGGNVEVLQPPSETSEGVRFSADEPWNRHMVQIPLLRPRKTKSTQDQTRPPQCLEQPHLQQPKQGSVSQVSTDGSRRHSIYTRWSQPRKRTKTAVCNVDRREGGMLREGSQRQTNTVWYHL